VFGLQLGERWYLRNGLGIAKIEFCKAVKQRVGIVVHNRFVAVGWPSSLKSDERYHCEEVDRDKMG